MTSMESNVDETETFCSGLFLNTRVIPLDADTTRMRIALRWREESRNVMGTRRGLLARRGVERGRVEEVRCWLWDRGLA